jgi:CRP-like cAMP-binding protein
MVEPVDLQKHSLFGGLEPEQIEIILSLMKQETFEMGADIIVEGQPNDRIFFILEGRAEARLDGVQLFEFEEGSAFGEMSVLDVMASSATVRTLAPTRVISLSNHGLHELYKQDLKIFAIVIMNLARELSRRLRRMNAEFVNMRH